MEDIKRLTRKEVSELSPIERKERLKAQKRAWKRKHDAKNKKSKKYISMVRSYASYQRKDRIKLNHDA